MDAAQALVELKQISAQIDQAVILEGDSSVIGSTIENQGRAEAAAKAAARLLEAAGEAAESDKPIVQLEASLDGGSVVIVREGDRAIAATTTPEPTIGLVFYDLRTCLREVAAAAEESTSEAALRNTSENKVDENP
jgi:predicted regulator of Ras-like GTPase activity (Roadblock/LC7/MglB family)